MCVCLCDTLDGEGGGGEGGREGGKLRAAANDNGKEGLLISITEECQRG